MFLPFMSIVIIIALVAAYNLQDFQSMTYFSAGTLWAVRVELNLITLKKDI